MFLPSSSPLNSYGVDIIVASPSACAAYKTSGASISCITTSSYALPDGTYYYLGLASDLGMTSTPTCGA